MSSMSLLVRTGFSFVTTFKKQKAYKGEKESRFMDFRQIIEQLSEEKQIPLRYDDAGVRIGWELCEPGYSLQYSRYPRHPHLRPRLSFVSDASGSVEFAFGAKEAEPLNLGYTIRGGRIMDRLEFFRKSQNSVGARFLEAFLGAEYEPLKEMFQAPTWNKPEEVDKFHQRSLIIPSEEFLPFIREHLRLS